MPPKVGMGHGHHDVSAAAGGGQYGQRVSVQAPGRGKGRTGSPFTKRWLREMFCEKRHSTLPCKVGLFLVVASR